MLMNLFNKLFETKEEPQKVEFTDWESNAKKYDDMIERFKNAQNEA